MKTHYIGYIYAKEALLSENSNNVGEGDMHKCSPKKSVFWGEGGVNFFSMADTLASTGIHAANCIKVVSR